MNKVEKIREEIKKRYEYWKEKESNSHSIESESRMSECNHLLSMIISLSDTEKDFGIKESVIPFGALDSELMEATYFIPQGYHAVIEGDKVIIKKGEEPVSNDLEEEIEKIWLEQSYLNYDKLQHVSTLTYYEFKDFAKHFAQWQKERDQSTIELAEDHAMLAGMEKMKEEIIDKAMVWLTSNMKWGVVSWDDKEQCVWDFKKAMKE